MLNILTLDQKYISYTLALKRYLAKFLFSGKPFPIHLGATKILVKPRSSDLFTIYEIYTDRGYLPKITHTLGEIRTVVDFGANIGVFSIWAADLYKPKIIYAVEMEPVPYGRLLENIALNQMQDTICPIQAAIYCSSGPVWARKVPGSEFYRLMPGRRSHHVQALSFADFFKTTGLEQVDMLKVDIEGAEKYLLTPENARLFKERVRYVVLETHTLNEFRAEHGVAYFQQLGFELAMTPTPYVIDRNFIIDAYNPAL